MQYHKLANSFLSRCKGLSEDARYNLLHSICEADLQSYGISPNEDEIHSLMVNVGNWISQKRSAKKKALPKKPKGRKPPGYWKKFADREEAEAALLCNVSMAIFALPLDDGGIDPDSPEYQQLTELRRCL